MSNIDGLQGILIGLAILPANGVLSFGIAWAMAWRTRNFGLVLHGAWLALNASAMVVVLLIGGAL